MLKQLASNNAYQIVSNAIMYSVTFARLVRKFDAHVGISIVNSTVETVFNMLLEFERKETSFLFTLFCTFSSIFLENHRPIKEGLPPM